MKLFTKTITAVLMMGSFLVPTPAEANVVDDHNRLLRAIGATGVVVKINPASCDADENNYGWYWAANNELVVCQENKIYGSTRQVQWTAEDFDTIRHEAHHVTQDCLDNSLNGKLHAVYKEPIELALSVLTERHAEWIIKHYSKRGEHVVVMELEAFAVAAMNDPAEQVSDIQNFCF